MSILDHSTFGVVGAARSGVGAARLLLSLGKKITIYDDRDRSNDEGIQLVMERGVRGCWGEKTATEARDALRGIEVLIPSPGVPGDQAIRAAARELGLPQVAEIELAWLCSKKARTIAVTGTKGKTTTTMLARHLIASGGKRAVEAGNIGHTFSEAVLEAGGELNETIFCVEVSSFQLEDTDAFNPDIAIVVNVTPDHLDRHKTMDEYWAAKRRITANQGADRTLIINQDDPQCLKIAQTSRARIIRFSLVRAVDHGAWLDDDLLMTVEPGTKPKRLIEMEKLKLRGMHNVANCLAASCAALAMGAPRASVAAALESFRGAPHRLEHIATIGGIEYFNDSKATNIDSVMKAVSSFNSPIHLIVGGQDKKLPFESIRAAIKERVARAYLIGEAAEKIAAAWKPEVPMAMSGTLERALEEASAAADPGDVILLSPGCASFDQFKNAEDRGNKFAAWVKKRVELQNGRQE